MESGFVGAGVVSVREIAYIWHNWIDLHTDLLL